MSYNKHTFTCIAGFAKSLSNVRGKCGQLAQCLCTKNKTNTFECKHSYSPPPRCFSTVVKWCNCFIMKFLFLLMMFNTSQRTVKLNPVCEVLKIMLKKLKKYDDGNEISDWINILHAANNNVDIRN